MGTGDGVGSGDGEGEGEGVGDGLGDGVGVGVGVGAGSGCACSTVTVVLAVRFAQVAVNVYVPGFDADHGKPFHPSNVIGMDDCGWPLMAMSTYCHMSV